MKRIFLALFASLLLLVSIRGNIAPPRVVVNEIFFDSTGNWTLEFYYYHDFGPSVIDSIRLESSSGGSLLAYLTWIPFGDPDWPDWYAVIGDSNLISHVFIDPGGDSIMLSTYADGWSSPNYDILAFGNYPGSYLDCLEEGESYANLGTSWINYYILGFTIDQSPTIGLPNDTTGAMLSIQGMVYDPDGEPMNAGWYIFESCEIHIQPDGSYSERACARRYTCDEITVHYPPWPYTQVGYYVQLIDSCLRPGTTQQFDFVTTGYVGVEEKERREDHALIVSPNPFSSGITFYPDWKTIPRGDVYHLIIMDTRGVAVHEATLHRGKTRYDWHPGPIAPAGIYVYSFTLEGRVIAGGRVVKR